MTITGQSAIPRDDIDRMIRDAEAHADEDRRRKEEADARNTADTVVYQAEKLVRDNGDKLSPEIKARLEEAQGEVRSALEGTDTPAIQTATDNLMRVSQEAGQALYAAGAQEQAGAQTTGGFTGEGATAEDDIVDAEIVDDEGDDQGSGTNRGDA